MVYDIEWSNIPRPPWPIGLLGRRIENLVAPSKIRSRLISGLEFLHRFASSGSLLMRSSELPSVVALVGFTLLARPTQAINGTVYAWGSNAFGQLGDGTTDDRALPFAVPGLSNVAAIGSGGYFLLAVLPDGSVRAVGRNNPYGELGDGTTTDRRTLVAAVGIANAVAIAGGTEHTLALLSSGGVMGWGRNSSSQLGDGTNMTPINPEVIPGLSGVRSLAAGATFSLALLAGGTVQSWGSGFNGQLGNGSMNNATAPTLVPGLSGVVSIACGVEHGLAVLSDGTVRAWGQNFNGQLGDGTNSVRTSPVMVSGISTAVAVSAGEDHSLAVLADGTVRAWGYNNDGELGDGSTTIRLTPVPVVGLHNITTVLAEQVSSFALSSDGRLWAWGNNILGQLGLGDHTQRNLPAEVMPPAGMRFTSIAGDANGFFVVALLAPACRADFNGSGSLTIQDIFDFLAAWFAGC